MRESFLSFRRNSKRCIDCFYTAKNFETRLLKFLSNYGKISKFVNPFSRLTDCRVFLGESDFVVYRPKASVLCPAYVIIKDRILNSFVLAIRGTHTTRDIFTSLSGAVKPHHYVDQHGVVMGYSHFGMLAAARWIFKHCKATLIDAHESQPDYKLILTGHSMGGGTAAMLTMMIREQVPQFANAQCYTFACPACMTIEIAKSCSPYVTTLIYGKTASFSFGFTLDSRNGCHSHDQSCSWRLVARRSGKIVVERFFQRRYSV